MGPAHADEQVVGFLLAMAGDGARRVATHASEVIIGGDDVFKLKKPLTTAYLDFSSPQRRLACCERELAINRRTDPQGRIYRGVRRITRSVQTVSPSTERGRWSMRWSGCIPSTRRACSTGWRRRDRSRRSSSMISPPRSPGSMPRPRSVRMLPARPAWAGCSPSTGAPSWTAAARRDRRRGARRRVPRSACPSRRASRQPRRSRPGAAVPWRPSSQQHLPDRRRAGHLRRAGIRRGPRHHRCPLRRGLFRDGPRPSRPGGGGEPADEPLVRRNRR